MLLWNARLVEWYYPALAHLQNVGIVDTANAVKVVEGLNDPRYSKARAQLALGARVVDRELVCPDCIASYLRRVAVRAEIKTSRRWRGGRLKFKFYTGRSGRHAAVLRGRARRRRKARGRGSVGGQGLRRLRGGARAAEEGRRTDTIHEGRGGPARVRRVEGRGVVVTLACS